MIQARASVCLSNRISFAYICILTNRSDSPPNQLLLPAQCLSTHYHLPFLNRIQINDNMYLHGQWIWGLSDNLFCRQANQIPRWSFETTRPYPLPIQQVSSFIDWRVWIILCLLVYWDRVSHLALATDFGARCIPRSTMSYQLTMFIACCPIKRSVPRMIRIVFQYSFDR
jgi:hypothetical protein